MYATQHGEGTEWDHLGEQAILTGALVRLAGHGRETERRNDGLRRPLVSSLVIPLVIGASLAPMRQLTKLHS